MGNTRTAKYISKEKKLLFLQKVPLLPESCGYFSVNRYHTKESKKLQASRGQISYLQKECLKFEVAMSDRKEKLRHSSEIAGI